MERIEPSRRDFINYAMWGTMGVIAIFGFYPVAKYLVPPTKRNTGKQNLGNLNLAEGESKKVVYGEMPVLIIKTPNKLVAYNAFCTHLNCIVNWDKQSGKIKCPCHGGVYDCDGNVVAGPPPKPLAKVAVLQNDKGEVLLGE